MAKIVETLGLVAFLLFSGLVGGWEATGSRLTVCTNFEANVYTFTDNQGHDWEWEAEIGDDFEIGKAYRLIMDNNHSSTLEDDIIKKIKKY